MIRFINVYFFILLLVIPVGVSFSQTRQIKFNLFTGANDINVLADECLRFAYYGLRAKDKSFNAKFETNFDNKIGKGSEFIIELSPK